MTIPLLVNMDVDDVERATDFYCRALGLEVGRRLGPSVVELLGASSAIYLIEKPSGSAAASFSSARRDYARHWTPVHLDFVVPEIHPAVARAQAAGAQLEGEVRTHSWGHLALMSDPLGTASALSSFSAAAMMRSQADTKGRQVAHHKVEIRARDTSRA